MIQVKAVNPCEAIVKGLVSIQHWSNEGVRNSRLGLAGGVLLSMLAGAPMPLPQVALAGPVLATLAGRRARRSVGRGDRLRRVSRSRRSFADRRARCGHHRRAPGLVGSTSARVRVGRRRGGEIRLRRGRRLRRFLLFGRHLWRRDGRPRLPLAPASPPDGDARGRSRRPSGRAGK